MNTRATQATQVSTPDEGTITIPTELVDIIILNAALHGDITVFLKYALVSRTWLALSRRHFFRRKAISLYPTNIHEFSELLNHRASSLPKSVQHLRLIDSYWDSDSSDDDGYPWLDELLKSSSSLSCITMLDIGLAGWERIGHSTKTLFLSSFQGVTKLEIFDLRFSALMEVFDIICAFPQLETVVLDDLGWEDKSFDPPKISGKQFPSSVRNLLLSNCYERDIFNWLLTHEPIPLLHRVELGSVSPLDAPSIGQYLKALGSELHSLRVAFSSLDAGGDAGTFYTPTLAGLQDNLFLFLIEDFHLSVDLVHNSELRTIRIDKLINHSEYQFSSPSAWVPPILSRIRSNRLQEVTFGISLSDVGQLDSVDNPIDWALWDRVFCQFQFPQLRSLCFSVNGGVNIHDVMDWISERMPSCKERGILCFAD